MIEGVQGKGLTTIVPPIWCYFPLVSSPLGSSTTVGLWVSSLFFVYGRDLDMQIDYGSGRFRLLEWRDLKVMSLGTGKVLCRRCGELMLGQLVCGFSGLLPWWIWLPVTFRGLLLGPLWCFASIFGPFRREGCYDRRASPSLWFLFSTGFFHCCWGRWFVLGCLCLGCGSCGFPGLCCCF